MRTEAINSAFREWEKNRGISGFGSQNLVKTNFERIRGGRNRWIYELESVSVSVFFFGLELLEEWED